MFGEFQFGEGYFADGPGGAAPVTPTALSFDGGGMLVATQISGPTQGILIGFGM